jgi:hypothetical protein
MGLKNYFNYLLVVLVYLVMCSSCRKESNAPAPLIASATEDAVVTPIVNKEKGVYLIYDGFGLTTCTDCAPAPGECTGCGPSGNGSVVTDKSVNLSYYNLATNKITTNSIGITGFYPVIQDFKIYGSKMYISYFSGQNSFIRVLNASTKAFIQQITLKNGDTFQPTGTLFYKNYLLIATTQNSIAMLDTAALTISRYFNIGAQGSQMVIKNDKLYIICNGNMPNGFIRIIDLRTNAFVKDIPVLIYPQGIGADSYGKVYVWSPGLGTDSRQMSNPYGGGIIVIDSKNDNVIHQDNDSYKGMCVAGNKIYLITIDNKIEIFDAETYKLINPNLIAKNPNVINAPYYIVADTLTDYTYVYNAPDPDYLVGYILNPTGKTFTRIFVFDKNYNQVYDDIVGLAPIQAALAN